MANSVKLHVYDLSNGMARMYSRSFIGKHIEAIYHTGIVVYNTEYYFGGGILHDRPHQTPYGQPMEVIELGNTDIPQEVFVDFLEGMRSRFSMDSYHLIDNNCNHFSNECSNFLLGTPIPNHIVGLPQEVMSTPFGMMIQPLINSFFSKQGWGSTMGPVNPAAQPRLQQPQSHLNNNNNNNNSSSNVSHPKTDASHKHAKVASQLHVLLDGKPALFNHCDVEPVIAKLRECTKSVQSIDQQEFEQHIKRAQSIIKEGLTTRCTVPVDLMKYLERLANELPEPQIFPVLELVRMLMLKDVSNYYTSLSNPFVAVLINRLKSTEAQLSRQTELIIYRIIINCFSTKNGIEYVLRGDPLSNIVAATLKGLHSNDKMLKRAISMISYNLALYLNNKEHEEHILALFSAIHHTLESNPLSEDPEIDFRLLMALGTFMYCSDNIIELMSAMEFDFDKYSKVDRLQTLVQQLKVLV
ncbi:hypothetical protein SAMD00019534_092670 [Acytostelium subglobosum LB1]|uniref:hypothetical protein n=1 Tax=Acytostelium subglobosum LB1 TaxID=1410327 RepID=UPI000644D113|nr:hypothetical protein SAMD00019534_092670 [Acytostelium subglobosum LB1]GAM26092.1 hypothetical protein SAMD00019534_092670 [Acytostelium subglobosum LB1]|eukprot:XP_012751135.1 hypothetical protein SAMD00019534_092670 [Acytostelium subglobosum LB1]